MAAPQGKERDRLKAVLLEVFGTSDDEDDGSEQHLRINGLHHCKKYVDDTLQVNDLKCLACNERASKQV